MLPDFRPLLEKIEAVGKSRLQHLKPENLAYETKVLLQYQEEVNTAAQLKRYGVSLDKDMLGDSEG